MATAAAGGGADDAFHALPDELVHQVLDPLEVLLPLFVNIRLEHVHILIYSVY